MPPNLEAGKFSSTSSRWSQAKTGGQSFRAGVAILGDALKNVRLAFVEVSGGTPASMMPKTNMPEFPLEDEEELADEPAPRAPEKPKAATPPPARAEAGRSGEQEEVYEDLRLKARFLRSKRG